MIKLGTKVRDSITNFTGIATERIEYLHGSPRVMVEAQLDPPVEAPDPGPAKEGGTQFATLRGITGSELRQYWFEEERLVTA
jgi:hypothetical protein